MSTAVMTKTLTVALAGQPNTGKSTVFNRLTGARQHVGNWPGKTIEKKTGVVHYNDNLYHVVDLPGTYSLTANSLEENIARDFLIEEAPDVVIMMSDASQLERTLYLLTEIKLLGRPVILALNMVDVAEAQGKKFDIEILSNSLGVPVVPMNAAKGLGTEKLLPLVEELGRGEKPEAEFCLGEAEDISKYETLRSVISGHVPAPYTEAWMTVKLLEGDKKAESLARDNIPSDDWNKVQQILGKIKDGPLLVAGARYDWIHQVVSHVLVESNNTEKKSKKKSGFDKAATHPFWGKVIAIGIMLLSFVVAFLIATPGMTLAQMALPALSAGVRGLCTGAPLWVGSLFADGLIPGIGMAVMMLAFIFGVYLVFGVLENVGYLARLAYVFDTAMNGIGLHGKSFMPLLMSFGCNIAGVTGTRVIDSWRQRMITLVMVSIVPCMALWAVVSFMGTLFFGAGVPLVIIALLAVMVLHLCLTSLILRKFVLKGERTGLIMELPPYHKPNWKTIWGYVWNQVKSFLKRAGTLITLISLLVWALSYRTNGDMDNSILAAIGRFFDPVSHLMGLDWRLFVALIAAVASKEASLSVLAVLYGIGQKATSIMSMIFLGEGSFENMALTGALAQAVSPASALGFIFAFFFSIPCIGTVATIYSETKSLKWTIGASAYYTLASFVAGVLAYHIGLLIF